VTLLTGKVHRTSGHVAINGQTDELSKYSKLIGYVPQEDIMLRDLTVRDILMHSARMRLPKDWDYPRVKAKVLEIISFLGMSHVAQTIIGDEETRGISGGQRKRVNIGMELVAEPSVLFLDEPTSGLDSSTSFEVCSNLRAIAEQQGLTVGAVIHSPSPATFRQFHDFMLLGKGGHVCYIGPREGCVPYFESVGFTLPGDESPSDYFMDVVTGKVASEWDPSFEPKKLFEYWENRSNVAGIFANQKRMTPVQAIEARRRFMHAHGTESEESLKVEPVAPKKVVINVSTVTDYLKRGLIAVFDEWKEFIIDVGTEFLSFLKDIFNILTGRSDPVRDLQPFHMQLWFLTKRAFLQVYKNAMTLLSEMMLHFAAGIFISIAVQNFDFVGAQPLPVCSFMPWNVGWFCSSAVDQLPMAGMFIALGCLFAGIAVGTNTFGREKVVLPQLT
jgi:ABC-type multidrug transport system ATPase subunit